ncbi:MAG: hypothetical protein LBQ66_16250 [Planctomycetaceae bacterium]|jgi:hypothetical protein|nr:hypothetical protein [Planctomycetaceae bacterium]
MKKIICSTIEYALPFFVVCVLIIFVCLYYKGQRDRVIAEYDNLSLKFTELEKTLIRERAERYFLDNNSTTDDKVVLQLAKFIPFLYDSPSKENFANVEDYSLYVSGFIDGWTEYIMYQDAYELLLRLFNGNTSRTIDTDGNVICGYFVAINSLPYGANYRFIRNDQSQFYQKGIEDGKEKASETWKTVEDEILAVQLKYNASDFAVSEKFEPIAESDIRSRMKEVPSLHAIIMLQKMVNLILPDKLNNDKKQDKN